MSSSSASANSNMKVTVNPSRAAQLVENLSSVTKRISKTLESSNSSSSTSTTSLSPRLVAVSKLKPASDILALHNPPTSHLHFGENYVQELLEKSRVLPHTVRWHFIGGLQSNKAAQLAREVQSLWAVESVDSLKKASLLEKGRKERTEKLKETGNQDLADEPLRIFIQVNTSGEDSKSGVNPTSPELLEIARHVRDACPHLQLQGLMTIGAIARSQATTEENENEDFISLRESRDWLAKELQIEANELDLSMGMSEDFEGAVRQGSSEVRIGSTIFGQRPAKKDAKVLEQAEDGSE
ncbi:YggS family pyridoxal phosphate enzyme [Exophiala mesophila]|uniref:Pyridoxal phosphate homeostasis protein n=1 Tax=Exophiala mesophila TaxID=212818 RepID=A0A0D2A6S8_EXOME|nr:YggS family pyridoxal phosphate enzyme [Exophiala mesophila]KIV94723.1 YggS family pyridoxal phosphate enzyme [Exophiala mesophila]